MLDLTALARPSRHRVVRDTEGLPVIPGRLGQIEPHDGQALAVYTARPRVFARLWAVPGVQRWQTSSLEMRAVFPPERLAEVATQIGARRRRLLTPEAARKRSGLPTVRGTSASQKPVWRRGRARGRVGSVRLDAAGREENRWPASS